MGYRIWRSARRMGLRDKGMKESWIEGDRHLADVHVFCRTRIRIGIRKDGTAVQYCWRCERISEDPTDPPPKGREDVPAPEAKPVKDAVSGTVVALDIARKRAAQAS